MFGDYNSLLSLKNTSTMLTVVKGGKDGGVTRVPVQVKTGSKRCYGENKCSKSKFYAHMRDK